MDWTVTTAREHFAQLLDAAQQSPQLIYRHGQLLGAVVGTQDVARATAPASEPPLSVAFAELRALLDGEAAPWEPSERRDRANPFAEDEVEDGRAPAM